MGIHKEHHLYFPEREDKTHKEIFKEKGLPASLSEFISILREKIEWVKEIKPFGTHIIYIAEFLKDIIRFLENIKDYSNSVENFERLRKEIQKSSGEIPEPSQVNHYENSLSWEDMRRKILHDSAIKNFIRLILSYKNLFSFLAVVPEDKYLTKEQKEKILKEKFPWGCKMILNERGELQEKYISEKEGVDLSFLPKEDRDILSEWFLSLSKELKKAEEIKHPLEDTEENRNLVNLSMDLKFLEEELKEVKHYSEIKKDES